jgi:hypothetical protein
MHSSCHHFLNIVTQRSEVFLRSLPHYLVGSSACQLPSSSDGCLFQRSHMPRWHSAPSYSGVSRPLLSWESFEQMCYLVLDMALGRSGL